MCNVCAGALLAQDYSQLYYHDPTKNFVGVLTMAENHLPAGLYFVQLHQSDKPQVIKAMHD